MYKLEDWELICYEVDGYTAPELVRRRLRGKVYNNPKYEDGHSIYTSHIVEVIGNIVHTKNSVYELGKPSPEYVDWCVANNIHIPTEKEPIK